MKLDVLPLKNGCVSLGADTTAQAAGETRPITMTLGPSCSHRSKYIVIELGDHDVVLGLPFLSYGCKGLEMTVGFQPGVGQLLCPNG